MASDVKHSNRLVHETSPYLLQHAHNPVDWYPWGEEALAKSLKEDKPILLSIGYSSCHWCHVMERESFEDPAIARLMNDAFVCIKVDREERPDIDEIYMAATQAMNQGQGGWPLTVFLTPEQKPFFAGTYFPPTDRWGRPGFSTLLTRLSEAWRTDRERLVEGSVHLTALLREESSEARGRIVGEDEISQAVGELSQQFDERYGGFGGAPKFPPSTALSLLLRYHRRTGDERYLVMTTKTLEAMARGGIYDQVGGGFARYSTDERWLVPHFEKMLYDNALLAKVYLEAFQVTGEPLFERIGREVLDYVLREMTSEEGGFYSATDADSEGVEGKYFVWTPAEVREIIGAEAAESFCDYFDIQEGGNWEGKSVLNVPQSLERVAERRRISVEALDALLEKSRKSIYKARLERVPPALDDKILTSWNALMISSLAMAYRVLGDLRYADAARRAADFMRHKMVGSDGRLLRTYRRGKAHLNGYLEDYAYLSDALIDLYEAVLDRDYLERARELAGCMLADFLDEGSGAFFSTAWNHERLIVRRKEGQDGATPSANAVAAETLARLSVYFDSPIFRSAAERAVLAHGKLIQRAPRAFCKSLDVVDFLLEGPTELVLVGQAGREDLEALRCAVNRPYLPNRVIAHRAPDDREDDVLPMLRGKGVVDGKATLYVCRGFTCTSPVTDPLAVSEALGGDFAAATEVRKGTLATRLDGAATPEGTRAYTIRFGGKNGSVQLASTGLWCSRVGFGGYRVDDDTAEHGEALTKALLSGCNLIDTSTNYTDGGSERLIGEVLRSLVHNGRILRQELIVVSKIGYVQGKNLELARSRLDRGEAFPDMVQYMDECWHCINPSYLEDQLGRSLERLQLEVLDVCLLHNPEYYLSDAKKRGELDLERLRAEFYRRIRKAFTYLEQQVNEGRIRWYGVSSNSAAAGVGDFEVTSLTRMLEIAGEVGGKDHHFAVLQLPMNLLESDAVFNRNNGTNDEDTVLDHARRHGIGVLVNRPLNAIGKRSLFRLADFPSVAPGVPYDAQLSRVEEIENGLRSEITASVRTSSGEAVPLARFFCWADEVRKIRPHLEGYAHWRQLESGMIRRQLGQVVRMLDGGLPPELAQSWHAQRDTYLEELNKLFSVLEREAAEKSQRQSDSVSRLLGESLPAVRRDETLSRKALWIAASTPGVSCVLNGMRRPSYVEDALGILEWDPVEPVHPIYQKMRDLGTSGELGQ